MGGIGGNDGTVTCLPCSDGYTTEYICQNKTIH